MKANLREDFRSGRVAILAMALVGGVIFNAVIAAGALAQANPRPILPRGKGPQSDGPAYEVDCGPCHAVSIYDPHLPVTDKNNNHTTIQQAIDHTKPGGTVIVNRDRNRTWFEPFIVRTPNITIKAADAEFGGTVVIRQEAMACVSIEPAGGRRFSDITTTIEGFTFIANDGALEPCIKVKKGKLKLVNSRIDLGESSSTGISVEATGELSFSGSNYDEHGIFAGGLQSTLPGNQRNGIGIRAEGAKSVMLTGVRLQGLETALISRAEVNALTGVRFFNNGTAVTIEDAAVVSAYAPGLLVSGGAFIENTDAIKLTSGGYGAETISRELPGAGLKPAESTTRSFARPFRGRILITADVADQVVFEQNQRGLTFNNAYPTGGLRIENAQFLAHGAHALKLNLPRRTRAEISAVDFDENANAILIDGSFDGELSIGNGSTMFGIALHRGITIDEGRGRLAVNFANVIGIRPIIQLGEYFDGLIDLTVCSTVTRSMIYVSEGMDLCRFNLRNKADRKDFGNDLADLRITINARPLEQLFGENGLAPVSNKELNLAQDYLCGRISPEDELR